MLSDEQLDEIYTNAIEPLWSVGDIDCAITTGLRAVAEAAVKDATEKPAHQTVLDYNAAFNGDIPMPTQDEIAASVASLEKSRNSEWGQAGTAWAAVKDAVGGEVVAYAVKHPSGYKSVVWVDDSETLELAKATPYELVPLYDRPKASAAVPDDWREVMQGLVECARDEIVRCEGMKCREPNCISCNDELEATTSVERSREFVFRARAMLAASQPEVKNAD